MWPAFVVTRAMVLVVGLLAVYNVDFRGKATLADFAQRGHKPARWLGCGVVSQHCQPWIQMGCLGGGDPAEHRVLPCIPRDHPCRRQAVRQLAVGLRRAGELLVWHSAFFCGIRFTYSARAR